MDALTLSNILKYENKLNSKDLNIIWNNGSADLREVLARKGNIDNIIQKKILESGDTNLQKNLVCNKFIKEHILLELIEKNDEDFVNLLLNNNSSLISKKIALAIINKNTQVFPLLYRSNLPKKVYKLCLQNMSEDIILDSYPSSKQFSEKILKNDSDLAYYFLSNTTRKNMWCILATILVPYKKLNLYKKIIKIIKENPNLFNDSGFAGAKRKLINDAHNLQILYCLKESSIISGSDSSDLENKIKIFETALENSPEGRLAQFQQASIMYRYKSSEAVNKCASILDENKDESQDLLNELSSVSYEIFKKIFKTRTVDDKIYMLTLKPALEITLPPECIQDLIDSGKMPFDLLSKLTYFKTNKKLVIKHTKPLKNYLNEEYVLTALSSSLTSENLQTVLTLAPIWEGAIADLLKVSQKI
jgi:hypothetical protein